MGSKNFLIKGLGEVKVSKRRTSRHIRVRVLSDGKVSCSIPYWLPYAAGVKFASSKRGWIEQQQQSKVHFLLHAGDLVGKSHRVIFNTKLAAPRLAKQEIIIPMGWRGDEPQLEQIAYRAIEQEAKLLLPQRLEQLATAHRLNYQSVKVKKMRSRWGSCSSKNQINLSAYLIQLPWWLIDYVLLHELTHTVHHNHSAMFWRALAAYYPKLELAKQELKKHQLGAIYIQKI